MFKSTRNLLIIGGSLAVLYGISLFAYSARFGQGVFDGVAVTFFVLFTLLFVASVGIVALKDWARQLMLGANAALFSLFLFFPTRIHIGYFLMSVILFLYFKREDTRLQFITDWRTGRKSILVIDDDEALQKTIKRILLPSGYSVLRATTGERGMQVARVQKPDLILLDVILPVIKGREVCAVLTEDESTRNIPIVFLTAKDSPDDIDAEMAAGGTSHLTKPVEARSLLSEIKRLIG